LLKAGYANQDDANYFGMKILEHYPKVAKAIIHRFPLFMVDEAQDTSEIQMKIIDLLIDNGLENIMLVGDPDQAISNGMMLNLIYLSINTRSGRITR